MKAIRIGPPTGYLDLRSNPEDVQPNGYRWALNVAVQQKLRLCRSTGWRKFLDRAEADLRNFDLHDQMHAITGVEDRKPYTFLMETASPSKAKILIAGNDRTLKALMLGEGTWRVLNTTPMGVDGVTRWQGTQNGQVVVFTNDWDKPQYWPYDGASLAEIDDLNTLGITRVGLVVTWNDFTIYFNLVEKGVAKPSKMIWSDMGKPLSLIPSDSSLANSFELDDDETILNALPNGNFLLIYTTRRIWQLVLGSITLGEVAFNIAKRYDPKDGEACLAYKNSLVTDGKEHVFASREGIYSYDLFREKPTLVEWIHRGSSYIFDSIDRSKCDWFIGKYYPDRREIHYSWVNTGDELPESTFVINTEFPFTSILDYGSTAYEIFQANEPVQSLADWIVEQCICDSEEFAEVFGTPENEGEPCVADPVVTCDDPPDAFYTTVTQELEDGIVMEDWNEAEPSENSLCSRLADTTISDLCADEARRDQCNAGRVFVMANAEDLCLKELTNSFYRERCIDFDGCGEYEIFGYKSVLRSGPLSFNDVANEKLMQAFKVEAIAPAANVPGQMAVRFGVSSMPLDSNDATCGILWYTEDPKTLDCVAVATATHEAEATRPDENLEWPTLAHGQFLYFELTVENPEADPVDTGAAVCISSYVANVEARARRY